MSSRLCQRASAGNLVIQKVYGYDRMRLLRCRACGAACSERRGTALCNTKLPEAKAEDVISHLGEGCSVRATTRLVHGLTPKALEFDVQWRVVKKSRSGVRRTRRKKRARCGITPR